MHTINNKVDHNIRRRTHTLRLFRSIQVASKSFIPMMDSMLDTTILRQAATLNTKTRLQSRQIGHPILLLLLISIYRPLCHISTARTIGMQQNIININQTNIMRVIAGDHQSQVHYRIRKAQRAGPALLDRNQHLPVALLKFGHKMACLWLVTTTLMMNHVRLTSQVIRQVHRTKLSVQCKEGALRLHLHEAITFLPRLDEGRFVFALFRKAVNSNKIVLVLSFFLIELKQL